MSDIHGFRVVRFLEAQMIRCHRCCVTVCNWYISESSSMIKGDCGQTDQTNASWVAFMFGIEQEPKQRLHVCVNVCVCAEEVGGRLGNGLAK